jgi:hypothetical protein
MNEPVRQRPGEAQRVFVSDGANEVGSEVRWLNAMRLARWQRERAFKGAKYKMTGQKAKGSPMPRRDRVQTVQ